jgi:hypothetical protein
MISRLFRTFTIRFLNFIQKITRTIYKSKKNKLLFINAHKIITPFSGFFISDLYLSEEIDFHRLGWINKKSKRLNSIRIKLRRKTAIIYCQVDQLEQFSRKFLHKINFNFVLITGKWHLPSIEPSETVRNILKNAKLSAWYSQNQIFDYLNIKHFPYGVNFFTINSLCTTERNLGQRDVTPLIPYSTIHPHMKVDPRHPRRLLENYMEAPKSLESYLLDLQTHKYVVCTPGDRPDTYRHWETVVSGATPICEDIPMFREFFLEGAYYLSDFSYESVFSDKPIMRNLNRDVALVGYWKQIINNSLKVSK